MSDAPATLDTLIETLRQRGLLDARLESAFREVPRQTFLPGVPPERVYEDEAIVIKRDRAGMGISSSSQPSMMAIMLRQLNVQPGHNVLEIGTGTGYNAALLQTLVGRKGRVTSVELDHDVVRFAQDNLQRAAMGDVLVVEADGAQGYAPRASYDRIIATVGVWDVPDAWVRQLKPRGVLVAPLWFTATQLSAAFDLQPDGTLYSARNVPCGFINLRGLASGPRVLHPIGSSGLNLYTDGAIDAAAIHALLSEGAEVEYIDQSLVDVVANDSLLPYIILNAPDSIAVASYYTAPDSRPYGIEAAGIALIGRGSACFVGGDRRAWCFAGVDAYLTLQDLLTAYQREGQPPRSRLRVQLRPKKSATTSVSRGRVFPRADHDLHAWLD